MIPNSKPYLKKIVMKLSIWKSERPAIKHKGVNLYDCSDCSVAFLLETGLKIHISTVHGNGVRSSCPICGRILKTAALLKNHISNMHEGKIKPSIN